MISTNALQESPFPGDFFHWADNKKIGKRRKQCDDRHDHEGHEKVPGVVNHKSRDCRREEARKISNEILQTRPAAGHFWPGQSLRDGPDIRAAHTARGESKKQQNNGESRAGDGAGKKQKAGAPRTDTSECFANQRWRSTGGDPTV